jgi:hypothetical protein
MRLSALRYKLRNGLPAQVTSCKRMNPAAIELTLRRYVHRVAENDYTNTWVADFAPVPNLADVALARVPERVASDGDVICYSVYPKAANKTFFERLPFWVFSASREHVAHAKVPDMYPYFELGGSDVFVVWAPSLEAAKSKLSELAPCKGSHTLPWAACTATRPLTTSSTPS